jgi:hypothetical protein
VAADTVVVAAMADVAADTAAETDAVAADTETETDRISSIANFSLFYFLSRF